MVALYDMVQPITESERKNFVELSENGRGLVVLHHALVSYREWPLFEEIIGGRFHSPAIPEVPVGVLLESGRLIVEFSSVARLPRTLAETARTAKEYSEKTKDQPAPSTFEADVRFDLQAVKSAYPVFAGVNSFTILDGLYGPRNTSFPLCPSMLDSQPCRNRGTSV